MAGQHSPVIAALRSSALFSGLPAPILERVAASSNLESRRAGAPIFAQGAVAKAFFIVVEGWVKLMRARPDGRQALLTTFAHGETFAEAVAMVGGRYPATAIAATGVTLARIEADALRKEIRETPEIGFAMIAATAQHLNQLVRQIEQLKLQSGDERVAEFLLALADKDIGPAEFTLPVDKRLIADKLGMAQETLSRAFARLRAFGVEVDGASVNIRDVAGLQARIERRA
ncbi:MAG TPA: Crp/Fnr family transcriptional regulator [Rhodoblastus sp.]|nr:Crp/Fnr family transcriptional regulator [Rhodoblastus sp.]